MKKTGIKMGIRVIYKKSELAKIGKNIHYDNKKHDSRNTMQLLLENIEWNYFKSSLVDWK